MKSEFYLSLIENLRNDSVKDLDSHFLRIKKMIAISIFLLSIFVSSSDNENIEVFSSEPDPTIILVDFQNEGYWAPYRITDRSKWQATANSEETKDTTKVEGPIQHIYDGTREKYWHTRWGSGSGNHDDRPGGTGPYHFIIDLGEETTFRAFSYTPRVKGSDGWQNGNILHYEFYIAESKEEIENKISSDNYLYKGDFQYTHQQTSTDQTSLVVFSLPETSRFIALRSIDHGGHASCSEFNLYTDPLPTPLPTPSPKPTPMIIMVDFQNEGYWAPYRITDRSKWQATANSEETKDTTKVEGPIQHIYDGTREKYWHTRWGSGSGNHDDRPGGTGPYHFIIDLGEETTFRAFSYTPRVKGSDGWQNGNILHYEFYIAESKEEIENKISSDNYLYKGDFQYTHQQTSTDQTSLVVFSLPETSRFIALRSIDHGGHASCSEFNLYTDPPASPEPTQSPSPHPSVTPEPSQTPLPTEPEKVPDPTIIKEENRDENRRVDRIINQTESVMLKIEVSLFEKINHPDDGGAIHVINAGIQCNGNHFDQCTSTKAGGAIYVNNDYDFLTLLSFEHLEIKNCVAQCGGGIFIRTTSNKNAVNIKSCQFESNTASATENDNVELYGGSAIYLNAPRGVIIRNRFNGNTGEGGSIKLCNSFEEVSKSSLLLSKLNEVLIKDCLFEISKKEKCSIFYDRGSKGSLFKLDQCTFTGKLSPGSNYICGRVISNDSQMLLVKKCKFGYNLKDLEELKMNSMHFMKMDVSEQVTIDGEKKKGSFALSKVAIVLAAVAAVAALAVCLFIFFTKKSEKEESSQPEESEIDQEFFNSLI